jgi:hypothetical protein
VSLFDTPLYKAGVELNRTQWAELKPALKACRSPEQERQCYAAYGHKHRAELDALIQQHGHPGLLWPA